MSHAQTDLVLVNMPFGSIQFPSIQLGLLKAIGRNAGFVCEDLYANVEFARLIGPELYDVLAQYRGVLIGEWIFTKAAFPDFVGSDRFADEFASVIEEVAGSGNADSARIAEIRETVAPAHVEKIAQDIAQMNPRAVGFTSTHEQNVAALAVARVLKERHPHIRNIFGGANYDGAMGTAYFEAFDWIDIAVAGEADALLVPLLTALRDGTEIPELKGILDRASERPPAEVERATYSGNMNDLPTPVYDGYFRAVTTHALTKEEMVRPVYLPIESSRGCWWGEKHHCTFCGLNSKGMSFRAKTADKVIEEIRTLTEEHRLTRIAAVDNIIGMVLMKDLTRKLRESEYDYEIFYEIKSNLDREQIRNLRNAGITRVQPGIESLSTRVLSLMRKGITAIRNVNTLRWLRYYEIEALWNVIHGFPGETEKDYADQYDTLRLLSHLQPPRGVDRIWLERFSPYFSQAQQWGFRNVRPERSFACVYPEHLDHEAASYFFNYDVDGTVADARLDDTRAFVENWRDAWSDSVGTPYLTYVKMHAGIRICDGRQDPANAQYTFYKHPLSLIYLACVDRPRTRQQIQKYVHAHLDSEVEEDDLIRALDNFLARGLMMREDQLHLSLALPTFRAVLT